MRGGADRFFSDNYIMFSSGASEQLVYSIKTQPQSYLHQSTNLRNCLISLAISVDNSHLKSNSSSGKPYKDELYVHSQVSKSAASM